MSAWISWFCRTLSMRAFSTLRILPRSGRTACVLRSRPCLAEPPAEATSTTNSSLCARDDEKLGERRVARRAVGELARQRRVLQRALAPREVARLARRRAGLRGLDGLADDHAALLVVLLEELRQALVDDVLHEAGHARVAELGLRLALELRVAE